VPTVAFLVTADESTFVTTTNTSLAATELVASSSVIFLERSVMF
jgi:hypothetical protein